MKKMVSIILLTIISFNVYAGVLLRYPIPGVKASNNNQVEEEQPEEEGSKVFRFRHVNHDTEGWADIVIAQVNSQINVTDEVSYRAAAQNAGYDAYYTNVPSWRCDEQDFGPETVPEVDYGCSLQEGETINYILIEKPNDIDYIPVFLNRSNDREYGRYSKGTWLNLYGGGDAIVEKNSSSLNGVASAYTGGTYNHSLLTGYTYQLNAGDWIMTTDPATNNR